MSLFQCREYWSASPERDEECDRGCLVVANVDNAADGQNKIVTGSFSKVLRIYHPHQKGYKPDDLVLEKELPAPILQIEVGRFVSNSSNLALAVLFPRKLVVYEVAPVVSGGELQYYNLQQLYDHKLQRTAFNMCYGPFGGVAGRDFICVQSMDGQVSFFHGETLAFARFLNSVLVPGPLCYVPSIDAFCTSSSTMEVHCYSYRQLGASSGDKEEDKYGGGNMLGPADGSSNVLRDSNAPAGMVAKKLLQAEWIFNLGEHIVDIQVAPFSGSLNPGEVDILVLGERSLVALREKGTVRSQKRLEYDGQSLLLYPVIARDTSSQAEPDVASVASAGGLVSPTSQMSVSSNAQAVAERSASHFMMISTSQKSLMVYSDARLVWAARTTFVPVATKVARMCGIDGMTIMLSEKGQVMVGYMGTEPPVQGVVSDGKELDYAAMDAEHRKLLKVIRQANNNTIQEPKDKITLRAQVPAYCETDDEAFPDHIAADCYREGGRGAGRFKSVLVKLFVQYTGDVDQEQVNVQLSLPPGFHAPSVDFCIPLVKAGSATPLCVPIRIRASRTLVPSSLLAEAVAAYITPKGEPRSARCHLRLPLALACTVVPPLKNCEFMFSIETNREPLQLQDIFPDVLTPAMETSQEVAKMAANVMTCQYHAAGVDVTVLVSKKSGKYRMQSGSFDALALLTNELVERLTQLFKAEPAEQGSSVAAPLQVSFKEMLPMADFFLQIDQHFDLRVKLSNLRKDLDKAAHQFRVIQKRLLVRFKDKNPSSLSHLDVLMNATYEHVADLAAEMDAVKADFSKASNQLVAGTRLILMLIRLKHDLNKESYDVLSQHLSPIVNDNSEQGWEELTEAAMSHLLRTVLAKSAKDSATVAPPLVALADTAKLKRHIQVVIERISKGGRLVAAAEAKGAKKAKSPKASGYVIQAKDASTPGNAMASTASAEADEVEPDAPQHP